MHPVDCHSVTGKVSQPPQPVVKDFTAVINVFKNSPQAATQSICKLLISGKVRVFLPFTTKV
ncbi:MAG: hypothetical protein CMI02_16075 [Oceanospirillaceae bacterium]|nr:hypothetical protein [Oceanospirillaceae bacterium]MBT13538.1 hypothetical protein [Oceanospirillaceae bacterium]|tara:strand:- start:86375 stop:86560 length:186 start_codon:yes stop_codon:yes gene_type:complete